MKLIIQIPCFNEERQLPATLARLPREVPGFDRVEWLIIDDGSSDRTVEVARAHGVDHIVRLTNNKGLAAAFQAGLDAGLKLGAEVIVNTDADNQYEGSDIPKLVGPILRGEADMVVGDRQVKTIDEFSAGKKLLQRLGSWVVRHASATGIPDTTSGFRAYNREAALQMHVVSKFTYTLETIIQAGKLEVAIDHVPIRTNPKTRESRLFPSVGAYVRRNALTIFRVWAQYEPLKLFWARRAGPRPARAGPVHPLPGPVHHPWRPGRARPVADPRRGAVLRRDAARRARSDRRPARIAAHADPADVRAGTAHRAPARRRALALRAGRAGARTGRPLPGARRRRREREPADRRALEV